MAEQNERDDQAQGAENDVKGPDAVKTGGIARTDADAEDVTRDTYGFEEAEPDKPTREERFAEAERAAEEAGIPGIVTPDEEQSKD